MRWPWPDVASSLFVGSRPTATFPETTQILVSLFGGQRDYAHDPLIETAIAEAEKTFDPKERAKVLQAFDAVDGDRAVSDVVQSRHEVAERRLARSGLTDEGDARAGLRDEADVL